MNIVTKFAEETNIPNILYPISVQLHENKLVKQLILYKLPHGMFAMTLRVITKGG